ncbi:S41 family peptidase [Daejeonella lutea]|uniref:Peptidase family S41 n=1 Tax=Daejeonella lutea TaxID=572036 RepID=A0A1T5F8K3_9SPHI|nr:S41 family peptidase [Daejeonella lutea]SKB92503.1 Peptidase family S41 [Daejeonella lutea]
MYKIILVLLFPLIVSSASAQTEATSASQPLDVLLDIFSKARQYSVYRNEINWEGLGKDVLSGSDKHPDSAFQRKVQRLFEAINDKHAMLLYKGKMLVRAPGPGLSIDKVRPVLKEALKNGPKGIKTEMLANGYGYILVPGGNKNIHEVSQQIQDSLCSLGLKDIKGLVVDLRLNEGGSIYPLFTGLHQLFGSKFIGYNSNLKGNLSNRWKVENGKYYQNKAVVASVKSKCQPNKNLKIVILTSQITASAGEILAVAFKGRENTVFIGENTYGLTTLNSEFKLGDYYLALSSAFIADRNGKVYYDYVSPDIEMIDEDNFIDLLQDAKIQRAMKWFREF